MTSPGNLQQHSTQDWGAPRGVLPWGALMLALGLACSRNPPPPLTHEAYVWQRDWSPELSGALAEAPPELGALRVLARERSGSARTPVDIGVDVESLARSGREVVAVMRVDGTAPLDGISLEEVAVHARAWKARGVRVRGLEVDHDCATPALPRYADWLEHERALLQGQGLTLSITALPTWASSPEVKRLASIPDDVVLQVHAVRAPTLFTPEEAQRFVESWSKATGRAFRVALPTYRVRLRDGTRLSAEPREVARLLALLRERPVPGVTGILWFRLGHRGDPDAWSPSTLQAVVRGEPLTPRLTPRLVDAGGGTRDIVIENTGRVDAEAPARLTLNGNLEVLDGVGGYAPHGASLVARTPPRLRAGERRVVGFVRGTEVSLAVP
ncbi:DUF3142 domain-containing protein [Myxococcus sp. RHSTA-1-4]|uniref:DUF3142 domain-containing protein n=1 Tax=Myxococcus sp. RHSTA-1-4 TaxID=2874601 RepID=UPI001CBA73FD|nr:DUF3142 domain-containing protein [Myxococcus sp. RHSTA-1-4]MBZ4416895.1 DUF3142 domain-containing protein [Myxococcus sp. RHSTA-1-4]